MYTFAATLCHTPAPCTLLRTLPLFLHTTYLARFHFAFCLQALPYAFHFTVLHRFMRLVPFTFPCLTLLVLYSMVITYLRAAYVFLHSTGSFLYTCNFAFLPSCILAMPRNFPLAVTTPLYHHHHHYILYHTLPAAWKHITTAPLFAHAHCYYYYCRTLCFVCTLPTTFTADLLMVYLWLLFPTPHLPPTFVLVTLPLPSHTCTYTLHIPSFKFHFIYFVRLLHTMPPLLPAFTHTAFVCMPHAFAFMPFTFLCGLLFLYTPLCLPTFWFCTIFYHTPPVVCPYLCVFSCTCIRTYTPFTHTTLLVPVPLPYSLFYSSYFIWFFYL